MDKIAVISDIHGNLEALKAVLLDAKEKNVDKIICIGDLIHKGVHFHECIDLVKNSCDIVLYGNTDDYFTKEHDLTNVNETEKTRILWNKNELTDEEREYIRQLPFCYEFYLSGSLVRLFHASPKSVYECAGIFSNFEDWYNMFLPTDNTLSDEIADVVIYGHLHTQFSNSRYNKTLINCGSVGNNLDYIRNEKKDGNCMETTRAAYLILEGRLNCKEYNDSFSYQLVKVPYDIDKELNNDLYNPEKDNYDNEMKLGRYRDLTKTYSIFEKDGVDIKKI